MPRKPAYLTDEQVIKVQRWMKDRQAFLQEAVIIINKDKKRVPFVYNRSQRMVEEAQQQYLWNMILKSRQQGITLKECGDTLYDVLFSRDFNAMMVAQRDTSVKKIFNRDLKGMWSRLPEWFRNLYRIETGSKEEMAFGHGSRIIITTNDSPRARSDTTHRLHLSEVGFWSHYHESMTAILQTAANNARVTIESTANGPNGFWQLWQETNVHTGGYNKLFLGWTLDETINYPAPLPRLRWTKEEAEYAERHGLSEEQVGWVRETLQKKCHGSWNSFYQEYPNTPEEAFILSGAHYFSTLFAPEEAKDSGDTDDGLVIFEQPSEFRAFSAGIDTATGEPDGDKSACIITDVTEKGKERVVAAFRDRLPISEFKKMAYELCYKYHAVAVIERTGGYGGPVIDYFRERYYPWMYCQVELDTVTGRWTERLGWDTTAVSRPRMLERVQEGLYNRTLDVRDRRIKAEINAFVWVNGKALAATGRHDDMLFALADSLMGSEQAVTLTKNVIDRFVPQTKDEVARWEMQTGRLWSEHHRNDHEMKSLDDIVNSNWG
jgi:hypothetical protein